MILLDLPGTLFVGPPPFPSLEVDVAIVGDAMLELDLTVDDSAGAAARPGVSGVPQVAGFIIRVDGVELPLSTIFPDMEVNLDLDSIANDFSFSTPMPSPLGSPLVFSGPEPGMGSIDILGAYLTPTGIQKIPLITNGIVARCERAVETDGSQTVHYTGADAGGRYNRTRITLYLPPGHGFTRDQIVSKMAALAGTPGVAVSDGDPMYHEVSLVDEQWVPTAKDMMQLDGRILKWDQGGEFSTPPDGWFPSAPTYVLGKKDVLRSTRISLDLEEDVITRIIATGNAQVLGTGAKRTATQIVTVFRPYAPVQQAFEQNNAGALAGTGLTTGVPTLIMVSRVTTTTEYLGDTVLSQVIMTEGWYNPISARYTQNSDGTWGYVTDVYLPPGSTTDDNTGAFVWSGEKFVCTARQETVNTYNSETGYIETTITRTDKPQLGRADVRNRTSTADDWTDPSTFSSPRFLLGDRTGVTGLVSTLEVNSAIDGHEVIPSFQQINPGAEKTIETITYTVDDNGMIHQQVKIEQGYFVKRGQTNLYDNSFTGSAPTETFQVTSTEVTAYAADETDSGHNETVTTIDPYGTQEVQVQFGLDSNLPAAPKLSDNVPAAGFYTDPTEAAALAKSAPPLQSQPITATYIGWPLEAGHPIREEVLSSDWAETPEELYAWAQYLVREGARGAFACALPVNFFLYPGMHVQFVFDDVDWIGDGVGTPLDVWLRKVTHKLGGVDGPLTSTISGGVYLVV